ncbi:MAG: heparinase II/III family protein, partial [Kiritimatiellaeota bacterium]|nr:heparinase II/III family protein [Kiritimatiellota bacterium]
MKNNDFQSSAARLRPFRVGFLIAVLSLAAMAAPTKSKPAAKSTKPYAELEPARIAELAQLLPEQARGFGAPCSDRAVWAMLATNKNFKNVISGAAKLLGKEVPPWNDDLYLDFSRTGKRPPGEKMIGTRHGSLRPLVWAECLENKGRFMPDIEKLLLEYSKDPSWTLPAHDRDLKNFKGTAYSVDLASSAFAHEVAQILWLLGDKISAGTRAKVMAALEQRIFAPLRESFRTGKGNSWLRAEMNWNPVCLAGGVGAALTVLPDRNDRALFAAAGEHYGRYYMAGFTPDGYCGEGMGYWNYGMSHFLLLREKLWQATGGKVDLFDDAKVRNAALYGINLEMVNGVYPAIADCRWGSTPSGDILGYLSRALSLGLRRYEDAWNPVAPRDLIFGPMEIFPNSLSDAKPAAAREGVGLRYFFEQAGVLVCRSVPGAAKPMGAVLKGGHNDEPHNHNDVGSFTLVLGKEALVADPGGPYAYSSRTFGKERYTAFKLFSSLGPNVPVIAGRAQIPGKQARAKILSTKFTDTSDEISMDIAAAYDAPELKKLVRTFVFDRQSGGLGVRDDFEFGKPSMFEVALTTRASWKQIAANQIELTVGNERVVAEIHAPCDFAVTSETIPADSTPFT